MPEEKSLFSNRVTRRLEKAVEPRAEEVAKVLQNPWDNVYWFARMLINSDKYGGPGKDSNLMLTVATGIRTALPKLKREPEEKAAKVLLTTLQLLFTRTAGSAKPRREQLVADMSEKLLTRKDFEVLALTCQHVMVPINKALAIVPSDDRAFAESFATALLRSKGEAALKSVITVWDDLGVQGSLTAERTQVVEGFGVLREHLTETFKPEDMDVILTAFLQEFERRLGQKRKGRAGRSLEDVTTVILRNFDIRHETVPAHITQSLEVDRLVPCKDGTRIGISCKRTLRERWKQAFTSDMDLLKRSRIKAVWHAITYDRDLSDGKIKEIGDHKGLLYLPDDSARYVEARRSPSIRYYVRPLTKLIEDLKREVG